tara:strand:+ start:786 stop:1850 length:1065 start_codon:yes stop_codon:yes gene_type:complete
MKILITGGAGFIGSCVVREVCMKDNHEAIVLDNLTYAGNISSLPDKYGLSNGLFEHIDICDKSKLVDVFKKHKPDSVMHLAAESHVDRSIENPEQFIKTNVLGTYNLLDVSLNYYRELEGIEKSCFKFHHISTDEVFGDLENIESFFTEDSSYDPSSPYSASKASSDHLVRAWHRTFDLPAVITNCSNNYGPYHFPEKLIPHIILNAIEGKKLPIYGDGKQIRDWLYVEDHARALIKVIEEAQPGQSYNIGGNNEKTNLEVVETICDILEDLKIKKPKNIKKFKDLIEFIEDRPGHDRRYAIDATKIAKDLNWNPIETFETGLRKTVIWYINNEDWWRKVLTGDYRLERLGLDK